MLEPWALRNSRWKKLIARLLWENDAQHRAACFHAVSPSEYDDMRRHGLRNPICVIPNGIDLPEVGGPATAGKLRSEVGDPATAGKLQSEGKKTLLYLGRLHPKKNLVALLKAWEAVRKSDGWKLVIAGWDQGNHQCQLQELTSDLGLVNSVTFVGPKFGDQKEHLYRNADAFVLPSVSEGLPMAVLEAWAYARPVVMTNECNLSEGFSRNAALKIGTTAESITSSLSQMFEMSDDDRHAMGKNGRALVAEKFSWPRIGAEMRAVYEWILGGGAVPETVRLK